MQEIVMYKTLKTKFLQFSKSERQTNLHTYSSVFIVPEL